MYDIASIRHVHLEISSFCNARCPLCPRNFYGYPFNDGYVEHNMTLAETKLIFQKEFVKQLHEIYVNGNFGDAVMNPEVTDILDYLKECNSQLNIRISTNGGARDKNFWQHLARLGVKVDFCIDGLEDTHSLYRQNTDYHTVINNAKIFIHAGGYATWKMIRFDHNAHQINQARQLSQNLNFKNFLLVDHGRNQGPVFDKNKKLVHVMGTPDIVDFDELWKKRTTNIVMFKDVSSLRSPAPISCQVKKRNSLYISSTGDVFPCCWLGLNPQNYGHGNYHSVANAQVRELINSNNALKHSLDNCIKWFNRVENTWQIPDFEQGRLIICNDVCGQKQ